MAFTAAQLTDLQPITPPSPSISVKVVKAKSHNSLMCAHAREGIFLKCKNIYTHFPLLFRAILPQIILHFHHCSSLPYHHRTLFLPLSHSPLLLPSAVSHSPTILFPPLPLFCFHHSPTLHQHALPMKSLCFTCTLRPFSRNSEISTLQNRHTFKKNLHFSSIFSLFRLISSHIHIGGSSI